jgi:hypothetical protein
VTLFVGVLALAAGVRSLITGVAEPDYVLIFNGVAHGRTLEMLLAFSLAIAFGGVAVFCFGLAWRHRREHGWLDMTKLTGLAIVATFGLAGFLLLFGNVGKMLTNEGDLTVWSSPFSHPSAMVVPDWTLSAVVLAGSAGPLLLLVLWCWIGLRSWKTRKP